MKVIIIIASILLLSSTSYADWPVRTVGLGRGVFVDAAGLPWVPGSGLPAVRQLPALVKSPAGTGAWAQAGVAVGGFAMGYMLGAYVNAKVGLTNTTGNVCEGIEDFCDWLGGHDITPNPDTKQLEKPGEGYRDSIDQTCRANYPSGFNPQTSAGGFPTPANNGTQCSNWAVEGGRCANFCGHQWDLEVYAYINSSYWGGYDWRCKASSPKAGQHCYCVYEKNTCVNTVQEIPGEPVKVPLIDLVGYLNNDLSSGTASTAEKAAKAVDSIEDAAARDLAEKGAPDTSRPNPRTDSPMAGKSGQKAPGIPATPPDESDSVNAYEIWNITINNSIDNSVKQNIYPSGSTSPETTEKQDLSWIDILVSKFRHLFGIDTEYEPLNNEGINPDENTEVLPQEEMDNKKQELQDEQETMFQRLWDSTTGLRNKILTKINAALPSGAGVCSFCWDAFGSEACLNFCSLDYTIIRAAVIGFGCIAACIILIV